MKKFSSLYMLFFLVFLITVLIADNQTTAGRIAIGITLFLWLLSMTAGYTKGQTNASVNANLRKSNDKLIQQLISFLTLDEQKTIWSYIHKLRDGDIITSSESQQWMDFQQKLMSKLPKDSDVEWLVTTLGSDLMIYGSYNYNPDADINSYLTVSNGQTDIQRYNLNLTTNEICYLSGPINYFEEKILSKNVSYGGISARSGGFRAGSVKYKITPNKGMALIDYGSYFVTNKRILFIGNKDRTIRQIPLNNIISYEVFKDSILLHTPNNKKPMLLQMEYDFSKKMTVEDIPNYSFRYDHIMIGFLLRKLLAEV